MQRSPCLTRLRAFLLALALAAALAAAVPAASSAAAPGQRLWAQTITDVVTTDTDSVDHLARGGDGSVYLCGTYDCPVVTGYLWAARYSSSGNQIWLTKWGEALGIDGEITAVAVDRWGNLIVVGHALLGGNDDIVVVKFGHDGTVRWDHLVDGVGGGTDQAHDVVVDRAGNVYVAAASDGVGTDLDYLVIKYSAAGVYRWESRYAGPGTFDIPHAIAIDSVRSTYVTGSSRSAAGDADMVTVKIDPDGTRRWTKRWKGPAHLDDSGLEIALAAGAVTVAGVTTGATTGEDIVLARYTPMGARRWVRTWDGPAHLNDAGLRLAVDAGGGAWTAGFTRNAGFQERSLLIRWSPTGRRQWVRRDTRSGLLSSIFLDLTVDAAGNAWVAGNQMKTSGPADVLVARYSASGARPWLRTWNGPGHDYDNATSLCLSGSTTLYVGGWSFVPGGMRDPILINYRR